MIEGKTFNLAVISDIHLGHQKNKAIDIIKGLRNAFPDNNETGELDAIFLAGDIFDRLLDLPNDDVNEIDLWIADLLRICSKRNIILRILEGTPSHDWRQSTRFQTIYEISKYSVNLKYIDNLSIEYLPDLDINILYVPDEWTISAEKTFSQVQELLKSKDLNQVDFAIMHGNFNYQLPPVAKKTQRHNEEAYLALVKHYIFIGHVHIHSSYDRIIAQGSFDRLNHGEEGPKGHVRASVNNKNKEFFFIENKLARVYKTLNCKNLDIDNTLQFIKKKVNPLPENSCVRISAESNHSIFSNMNQLVSMYPTVTWSKLSKSKEVVKQEEELIEDHKPITINKQNIETLLMDRLNAIYDNPILLNRSKQLLLNII